MTIAHRLARAENSLTVLMSCCRFSLVFTKSPLWYVDLAAFQINSGVPGFGGWGPLEQEMVATQPTTALNKSSLVRIYVSESNIRRDYPNSKRWRSVTANKNG